MSDLEIKRLSGAEYVSADGRVDIKTDSAKAKSDYKVKEASEDNFIEISDEFDDSVVSDDNAEEAPKGLEDMSKPELALEAVSAKAGVEECKTNYENALKGDTEELTSLKEAENEAYQTYTDGVQKVNVEMAEHLQTLKDDVTLKENELNDAAIALSNGEIDVSEKKSAYDASVSSRRAAEGSLSSLYAQLNATEDEDAKAGINVKISALTGQISKLKDVEMAALEALRESKENLEKLKKDKEEKEQSLEDAKKAQADYEAEINAAYPELEKLYNAYTEAKEAYENAHTEAVNNAKAVLDDAQSYLNDVNAALFKIEIKEKLEEPPTEEDEASTVPAVEYGQDPTYSAPVSSGGDTGGITYTNGDTPVTYTSDGKTEETKTATEDDLDSAKADSKQKLTDYEKSINGETTELSSLKETRETDYNTLYNNLSAKDPVKAQELSDLKEKLDKAEEKVNAKKIEVANQELVVSAAKNDYDNLSALVKALEEAYSDMEDSDDTSKLGELKDKIEEVKKQQGEAKDILTEEQEKLSKLQKEEKDLLEGDEGFNKLNEQMKALCSEIASLYPDLADDVNAYINSSDEFKTKRDLEAESAKTALISADEKVNSVKSELYNEEIKKTVKEYAPATSYDADFGNHLINTAREMLKQYGETKGQCAGGVRRTFEMACGIYMRGNGCDWIANMDKLVEEGYFIKVDRSEYPTSADLAKLPAGAVVAWESTGAVTPAGKYGHVCIADGQGGEISDHYEKNIYPSVGGRRDTYHIYLPVKRP